MRTKFLRRKAVMSPIVTFIFEMADDDFSDHKSLSSFLEKYPKNDILKIVFRENESCEFLQNEYDKTKLGQDNDLFAKTYKISEYCYIELYEDYIYVYTVDPKPFKVCRKKVFEWEYPVSIYRIAKSNGCSLQEIIQDFKRGSTVDIYLKYVLNKKSTLYKRPILNKKYASEVYSLDHFTKNFSRDDVNFYVIGEGIGVVIDKCHLYFCEIENEKLKLDSLQFISDTWCYTDKQLLHMLRRTHMYKYGRELKAYWVSPT